MSNIDITEIHDLLQEINDHAQATLNEAFDNDNNPDTKLCMAINQTTIILEKSKKLLEILGVTK
jgi:hypothetical protein